MGIVHHFRTKTAQYRATNSIVSSTHTREMRTAGDMGLRDTTRPSTVGAMGHVPTTVSNAWIPNKQAMSHTQPDKINSVAAPISVSFYYFPLSYKYFSYPGI